MLMGVFLRSLLEKLLFSLRAGQKLLQSDTEFSSIVHTSTNLAG